MAQRDLRQPDAQRADLAAATPFAADALAAATPGPQGLPSGAFAAEAGGELLWLLPGRAAFWPRRRTLLVADAHLGKAAAFRGAGFPVPAGTTEANLARLSALIDACAATRVVFLGDLVHDAAARRAVGMTFAAWREARPALEVVLVPGNHDRRARAIGDGWRIDIVADPFIDGGLALCHAPRPVAGAYAIAGHVHPCANLRGRGRDRLRIPCFWFTSTHAVLPAFGGFTGNADIEACAGDRVYLAAGDRVVALARGSDEAGSANGEAGGT